MGGKKISPGGAKAPCRWACPLVFVTNTGSPGGTTAHGLNHTVGALSSLRDFGSDIVLIRWAWPKGKVLLSLVTTI